jgi:hypothetical protein
VLNFSTFKFFIPYPCYHGTVDGLNSHFLHSLDGFRVYHTFQLASSIRFFCKGVGILFNKKSCGGLLVFSFYLNDDKMINFEIITVTCNLFSLIL